MNKEQDSLKRKMIISEQLKEKIKKKIYKEQINDQPYTYSLLKKKGQTFFMTNQRLLILNQRGIGYARNIPNQTLLPFHSRDNLPQRKVELPLIAIANVITSAEELIIQFVPESRLKNWQFVCDSKDVAIDWKQAILASIQANEMNGANQPIAVTINPSNQHQNNQHEMNSVASSALYKQDSVSNSKIGLSRHQDIANNQGGIHNNNIGKFEENIRPEDRLVEVEKRQRGNTIVEGVVQMQLGPPPQIKGQNAIEREVIQEVVRQIPANEANNSATLSENPNLRMQPQTPQHPYYPPEPFDNTNINSPSQIPDFAAEYTLKKANQPDLPILDCPWDHEFLKGDQQYLVIQNFKKHVQAVSKAIVDQLALRESLRQYHPTEQLNGTLKYHINSLILELSLLQLSQITTFDDHNTVISSTTSKIARNRFKNANYILQSTRNKTRFLVPLIMLTHYKGFQILATHTLHTSTEYTAPVSALQQDSAQLQQETRISRGLFENESNVRVVAADKGWYEKMGRNVKRKQFECCFLSQVRHYLPQNFFGVGREGAEHYQLRAQLLADQQYQGVLFDGSDLHKAAKQSKISNQTKSAINLLTQISSSIPLRASLLVQDLQNLDEIFTNSSQLSELMHSSGINIRYLGLLLQIAKEPWLRSLIIAEMAARAAKYYLRYDMQESSLNLGVDSVKRAHEYQVDLLINWLNKLLGVGNQSDTLWRSVSRQVLLCFRTTVNRDGINIGFFLQALQHHGCFRVDFTHTHSKIFNSNNLLTKHNFIQFTLKSTVYDPLFTDHYQNLTSKLRTLSPENFQSLTKLLQTTPQGLPAPHYSLTNIDTEIVLYMANWISPMQHPALYRYIPPQPSKRYYQLQCTSIKWFLKVGQIAQAQRIKDAVVQHIRLWLGEHPLLTQLYDIFGNYHLSSNQHFVQAHAYAKLALANQEKLLGPNHFKLADSYYSLAGVYCHYAKKTQALHCFKKALAIIVHNEQTNSAPYVQTALKVAELSLENCIFGQTEQLALKAMSVARELNMKEGYLSAGELLGRCYEVTDNWDQYFRLTQQIGRLMHLYADGVEMFGRVLKLVVFPELQDIGKRSREGGNVLLEVMDCLPERSTSTEDRNEAYLFLKGQLTQRTFPLPFLQYLSTFESQIQDGQLRSLSRNWRGFESMSGVTKGITFLRHFQAVCGIVGKSYIEGALSF